MTAPPATSKIIPVIQAEASDARNSGPFWDSKTSERGSALQPVGHLEQERVVRMGVEQVAEVAGERPRALRRREVLPPLVPHEEQRRPGAILPPQHQVGAELLEVEPAGAAHRIRLVAVVVGR